MFKTSLDGKRIEDYRWLVRKSWRQLDEEAGLSYGYLKKLSSGRVSMKVETLDAIVNAIARLLVASGNSVPDDLWYQIVRVEWVGNE